MCGIVGYTGPGQSTDVLIDGLRRLEYRGYDSAGVAIHTPDGLEIFRKKGRIKDLIGVLPNPAPESSCGIGHTRWATHGRPSETNAHPHRVGQVVVVHNGIIENHVALRQELEASGSEFQSETDTEIFAHLLEGARQAAGELNPEAVRQVLGRIEGSYGLGIIVESQPDQVLFARKGSPLIVGLGSGENFIASDIAAILSYTREMVLLNDGDVGVITPGTVTILDEDGKAAERPPRQVSWDPLMAEKGGFPHFMLKEIHDQPRAISDTMAGRIGPDEGRVYLEGEFLGQDKVKSASRIVFLACGTSYNAGLVASYEYERTLRIPVRVEYASEFRYRDPVLGDNDIVIAISQSGETADTLAAVEVAREAGVPVVAICNVVDSSLARNSDFVMYTHAGPEISVASTKAFVTQLVSLQLVLVHMAQIRGNLDTAGVREWLQELSRLPAAAARTLKLREDIRRIAKKYAYAENMLYLGRDVHFPLALEGALKLKEISYIHAEAYPAGEMKHGPIALVDKDMPVFIIVHDSSVRGKVLSNMAEIRARDGRVIALTLPGDDEVEEAADSAIAVESVGPRVDPILLTIPLQLFAYQIAVHRGTDVDQPRNLAKSVTVE